MKGHRDRIHKVYRTKVWVVGMLNTDAGLGRNNGYRFLFVYEVVIQMLLRVGGQMLTVVWIESRVEDPGSGMVEGYKLLFM